MEVQRLPVRAHYHPTYDALAAIGIAFIEQLISKRSCFLCSFYALMQGNKLRS